MELVTLALVVIAALFAIGSGVWVATALVSAISRPSPFKKGPGKNRAAQTAQGQADEKK